MEPYHLFFIRKLHVSEPWFSLIASGQKTIEARVGSIDKFASIVNSRIITFTNMQIAHSPHIYVSIRAIRHYDTLDNFLRAEGWIHCVPQAHTYEEARNAFLIARNSQGVPVFSDENTQRVGDIHPAIRADKRSPLIARDDALFEPSVSIKCDTSLR